MLATGDAIILEATLGFFGLGAQPPTPSWGAMMCSGTAQIFMAPWIIIFPGLAIAITVVSINLFGDALIEALDIRNRLRDGLTWRCSTFASCRSASARCSRWTAFRSRSTRARSWGWWASRGSGKSLTAMALMGLLPLIGGRVSGGSIRFDGRSWRRCPSQHYRRLRGHRIALISQNPMTSLDPMHARRRADRPGGAPASGPVGSRRPRRAASTC